MKNLFSKEDLNDVISRIDNLTPTTKNLWGKMNVEQMLAHCSVALEAATGQRIIPQAFIGKFIGRFFKSSFMGNKPIKRNGPTGPQFIIKDTGGFDSEKQKLIDLTRQFSNGGKDKCTQNPHSFFGKLTPEEWSILMYKHLDHHLQQFGV